MKLTPTQINIIRALAEFNMSTGKVADNLFYHRNTVVYHIERIKVQTGLNPKKFYDLCKLLEMIKEDTVDD